MKYDHNKKFGLLKFHSGYEKFNLNSPNGYSLKIINTQTDKYTCIVCSLKKGLCTFNFIIYYYMNNEKYCLKVLLRKQFSRKAMHF